MPKPLATATSPSWDQLYELAEAQSGYFSTQQAQTAGFSTHLLHHHIAAGRVTRARRGIYRLVHFPPAPHEDLVVHWLWSGTAGAFSHETALVLHQLSDALPAGVHMTVPSVWKPRRLRVPRGLILHFEDLTENEQTWSGPVPITNVRRTLIDCAASAVSPELVQQGLVDAQRRGLLAPRDITRIQRILHPARSKNRRRA